MVETKINATGTIMQNVQKTYFKVSDVTRDIHTWKPVASIEEVINWLRYHEY